MRLLLTQSALRELSGIRRHSIKTWGEDVGLGYMQDINAALERVREMPSILRKKPRASLRLRFYTVRSHVLIFEVTDTWMCLIAVWHGRMDLPERLEELEPQLVQEAELLARKVQLDE